MTPRFTRQLEWFQNPQPLRQVPLLQRQSQRLQRQAKLLHPNNRLQQLQKLPLRHLQNQLQRVFLSVPRLGLALESHSESFSSSHVWVWHCVSTESLKGLHIQEQKHNIHQRIQLQCSRSLLISTSKEVAKHTHSNGRGMRCLESEARSATSYQPQDINGLSS